jgi:SAM-dependent methyltransferase
MPHEIGPLGVFTCSNQSEYAAFVARHGRMLARVAAYEADAAKRGHFHTTGWCAACGTRSQFIMDDRSCWLDADGNRHLNWRERLQCVRCGLNNRMRAALQLMCGNLRLDPSQRVYLTEQTTRFYTVLRRRFPKVVGSEYLRDNTANGASNAAGIRCEDVTALSFPDASFDCIGSFDVLEHVSDFYRAIAEFARCLTPDGWLLLSAPFNPHFTRHQVRAVPHPDAMIHHILPPEYHGDPLSSEGVLCFYHFGWSLLDDFRSLGFADARMALVHSTKNGNTGGLLYFVIARRGRSSRASIDAGLVDAKSDGRHAASRSWSRALWEKLTG